jgi:hypothetical protein
MSGKVFIASMNLRRVRAPAPANITKVNVTSAQALLNKNRRDFSPMTPIEGGYEGSGILRHSGRVERYLKESLKKK